MKKEQKVVRRHSSELLLVKKKLFFLLNWITVQHPSGEGNGIPLQYSCLDNPMDGGAS